MGLMTEYSKPDLMKTLEALRLQMAEVKQTHLHLNMSRGKPAAACLDMNMELLTYPRGYQLEDGTDARNYGNLEGIPECRRLFGNLLGLDPENLMIGGSSSLNLMYDAMAYLCLFGTEGNRPWNFCRYEGTPVKFLCPVPGYDRHFRMCEEFGIEMIPVPLLDDGPDMDLVEQLVRDDELVKGIWCVPLHSNPQGVCYSNETAARLASMKTAAGDFRIFWDNAYGVHHIYEAPVLKDIIEACRDFGHPNRPYYFFSTSKITFPGAGISLISSSPANMKEFKSHMSCQTIGNDKLNQLRHAQYFSSPENIRLQMAKLADILRPKFDIVLTRLEEGLAGSGLAAWTHPKGGYFVSLDTLPGCAARTVQLAKEAGVTLTQAGATFPYGKDPADCNIRIAPSYPAPEELEAAMDILILCVKLAAAEAIINQ